MDVKIKIRKRNKLQLLCKVLEDALPVSSSQLLSEFNLVEGHPWAETAQDKSTIYYACLYGVVRPEKPRKILEIGTAFGMSAATMLKACKTVQLFVSIDLGIYGRQLGADDSNIDFARSQIHAWCDRNKVLKERVRFYCANTQPEGKGDNEDIGAEIQRWHMIPEVVRLLQSHKFDVIFVDGKHTDDGLLNDLNSFWPFLKPGGLMICDDLHDPAEYDKLFPWVGDTWNSFHTFIQNHSSEITDYHIWNFPQVPPEGQTGKRPFGLIRKKRVRRMNSSNVSAGRLDETNNIPVTQNSIPVTDSLAVYCPVDQNTDKIILPNGAKRVWLDVGANECETTLPELYRSDDLVILAFEPLVEKCDLLKKKHLRLIALPIAISANEGSVNFYRTANNVSSSLSPFNPDGLAEWKDTKGLEIVEERIVPAMRLERILGVLPVERVEFLKIDAQGHDLDVVKSAGDLIHKIDKIKLEVAVTSAQLYEGAATKDDVISYMTDHGFKLLEVESQTNGQEENLTFVKAT